MQEKNTVEVPAELIERIRNAKAITVIEVKDGIMAMTPIVIEAGQFMPTTNVVHAYLNALRTEHNYLLETVHGMPTDAGRYRALRDFGLFKTTDVARFEAINAMLLDYENRVMPPEAERTLEDQDRMADFVAVCILETEPKMTAPTTMADPKPVPLHTTPQLIAVDGSKLKH